MSALTSLEHNFVSADDDAGFALSETDAFASRQPIAADRESEGRLIGDFSVMRKLTLAVFGNTICLVFLAIVTVLGAASLSDDGRQQIILASIEVRTNNAAIALNNAHDTLVAGNGASDGFDYTEALTHFDFAIEALNDPIDFAGEDLPADLGPSVIEFRDRAESLRSQAAAARFDSAALAELAMETDELARSLGEFAIEIHPFISGKAGDLYDTIGQFMAVFSAIAVTVMLAMLFGSGKIVRDVVGKLRRVTEAMEKLAKGDYETAIPSSRRNDEIGDMARALGVFRQNALELSRVNEDRAREAEEQLERQRALADEMRALKLEKGRMLENLADGFEVSVGELITSVSAASEQLRATSVHMVGVAEGSNDHADSASSAMKSASHNVTAAAAATDEFALSINEISQQASASATLARDATSLVASANTRMTDLSEAAEEVGEIAELIQTIAKRTNLLALNASIEAARGGEAGRGFAVVASEVKELALQTSSATNSVAEKIGAMQESTRSSAGDLSSIYDQIGELEKVAVTIATAVDQQSVSGEELARNIDTVAEGSRRVSELLVTLRGASEETGTAAGDVVESANALGKHADDLRDKAGRFIADVRRSGRELEFENGEEGMVTGSRAA